MGGSDDPSNLVRVTIEQHAELHKQLWEGLGCWQDGIAWKMLSGQITNAEAIKVAQSEGGKKNKGKLSGDKNPFFGKKHSDDVLEVNRRKHLGKSPGNKGIFGSNNSQSRTYEITDPEGNVFLVKGLVQFCKENNLTYQAMGQVSKGKLKQHKKYKCKEIK